MVGKTIDLREKLENKLRDVVRCVLTFWPFPWKKFLWVMRKKIFPQKLEDDGGYLLIKRGEHLTTTLNSFSNFSHKSSVFPTIFHLVIKRSLCF